MGAANTPSKPEGGLPVGASPRMGPCCATSTTSSRLRGSWHVGQGSRRCWRTEALQAQQMRLESWRWRGPAGSPHGAAIAGVSPSCRARRTCHWPRWRQLRQPLRKGQRCRKLSRRGVSAAAHGMARVETQAGISSHPSSSVSAGALVGARGAGATEPSPGQPGTLVIHPPEKPVWAVTRLPHTHVAPRRPRMAPQPPPQPMSWRSLAPAPTSAGSPRPAQGNQPQGD